MKYAHSRRPTALLLVLALSLGLFFTAGCGANPEDMEEPLQDTVTAEPTKPQESAEPADSEAHTPDDTEAPSSSQGNTAPTESTSPPVGPSSDDSQKFYVRVNCESNTVTIYEQDADGAYTVPCMAMVCSSGLDSSPTPTGTYRPTGSRWPWLRMVGGVWGMYVTQIHGNYLFHSVPYLKKDDHGSLQPGEFDKLGQDASHGCIRLQVKDAKWIYDHMNNIEGIELFSSSEPDPLGKPSAPAIGDSAYPGWDPSDPVSGNPWQNAPLPTEPAEPAAPETTDPEDSSQEIDPEVDVPDPAVPEMAAPESPSPLETVSQTEADETVPGEISDGGAGYTDSQAPFYAEVQAFYLLHEESRL